MTTKFAERYVTSTRDEAKAQGYVAVTTPYSPSERNIFEKALESYMGTDYLIVVVEGGYLEFWRKKSDLKDVV